MNLDENLETFGKHNKDFLTRNWPVIYEDLNC